MDSSASQVWPLCPGCLSDELKSITAAANGTLECGRCLAKIDKPYHAVEIVVELNELEHADWVGVSQSGGPQHSCINACVSLTF